jgi:hypothetical protein
MVFASFTVWNGICCWIVVGMRMESGGVDCVESGKDSICLSNLVDVTVEGSISTEIDRRVSCYLKHQGSIEAPQGVRMQVGCRSWSHNNYAPANRHYC